MDSEDLLRLLIGLLFLGLVLLVSRYRRQSQGDEGFSLEEEGWAIVIPLRLAGLVMWLALPAYLLFPRLMARSTVSLPMEIRWAAFIIAALTVPPFVHWAQQSLGRNVTTTVITRNDHELVTEGPYRYIRHPLYTAGMSYFLAMSVATGSWLLLVAMLMVFLFLLLRLPKEEALLAQRFGEEYLAYQRRTGLFLPKFGGRSGPI